MRPVLEQSPWAALRTQGDPIQVGTIIGAQARRCREVVRAGEHVDAVDLEQVRPVYGATKLDFAGRIRPLGTEALSREGNAPR